MARQKGGALMSTFRFAESSGMPIYRQLETGIRKMILGGYLSAGDRLPSSRQLATDLGISRQTVKNVFEQLVTEGFLESHRGSGTFVGDVAVTQLAPEVPGGRGGRSGRQAPLSKRARAIAATKATTRLGSVAAFRPGVPALDMFPRKAWSAAHSRVMRNGNDTLFGYGPPGGLPELKRAIRLHVRDHRGIRCDEDQIVVTAGAQQAFVLIALTLIKRGSVVWCEDPGHIAVRDAMRLLSADVKHVPVDRNGFDLKYARQRHPRARMIFVTPSHQHPLGITMSLNRRLELLDNAQQHGCWIVEDDYDSEFRYAERALPAMQALDGCGHVLYVGSFSKSLFPALRIGYLISPPGLIGAFAAVQTLLSQNVSPLQQQVLASFMLDGSFNAHIRNMCTLYRRRRDLLVQGLRQHAGSFLDIEPCLAGMHLIGWLRDGTANELVAAEAIRSAGIDCLPLSIYCVEQVLRPGILFGFACVPDNEINAATRVVGAAMADALHGGRHNVPPRQH